MKTTDHDRGVIQALLERLNEQRLPRLLELKKKVDAGTPLADEDLAYLSQILADADQVKPFIDRHPEYQELVSRIVHLYHEITTKALQNETAR